jgi:molybdate transport system permease protein
LFGREGLIGGFLASVGLEIPFSTAGAMIAAFTVGLPMYVLAARNAFEAVDREYEEVSLTMGHAPLQTFWRVTLPLAAPGLAAGAVLMFARAIGEFGATTVLAGNLEGETRTISLAVYTLLESPSGAESIQVLVGASIALSFLAMLGYERLSRWQRRRTEVRNDG